MSRQIIPTSGSGLDDQWPFVGLASSWEAVSRGSDDTSYIYTDTSAVSNFYCGAGDRPLGSTSVAVTAHYRAQSTGSGASLDLRISRSSTSWTVGTVALPLNTWVDGEFRIRRDWISGLRFTAADLWDFGVGVSATVLPVTGEIKVSQLWLEVEVVDTHQIYDPCSGSSGSGVEPDAIVGPLVWTAVGSQPVTITADLYLEITEGLGTKTYEHILGPTLLPHQYVTEIETRQILTTTSPPPYSCAGIICSLYSGAKQVVLAATLIGADTYIGIMGPGTDYTDLSDYLAVVPVDFLNQDLHFRVKINREVDPDDRGHVQVFLNYSDTPLLDVLYTSCPAGSGVDRVFFGTTFDRLSRFVDYIAWYSYPRHGSTFSVWEDTTTGSNAVEYSSTDPDIAKPIFVVYPDPPGLPAGQSQYCGVLNVLSPADFCQVTQKAPIYTSGSTYELTIDYKIDIPGITAECVVQRCSDLWYWDNVTSRWSDSIIAGAAFDPNTNSVVSATAIQPDGKIIIVGYFTTVDGTAMNRVARLGTDGILDPAFADLGIDGPVLTVVLQSDGKIIIGGEFTTVGGLTRNNIARLNDDGTVDATFSPNVAGGVVWVFALAVQQGGKILVGGQFTKIGPTTRIGLARLNTNGSLDGSFNAHVNDFIYAIKIQADNKILIGGPFTAIGSVPVTRNRIARLKTSGALDLTFDPNADDSISAIAVQSDNKIVISGSFHNVGGVARGHVARINTDGTLDLTFVDPNVDDFVTVVEIQIDGKILIGRAFHNVDGVARNHIARLNSDGSLDSSFDPNADNMVNSIVVQTDNKVLVGGDFHTIAGNVRNHIGRLLTDGTSDPGRSAAVPLPNTLTRTRASVASGITFLVPDAILVTVQSVVTTAPVPPHKILLFKLFLGKE